MHLALTYRLVSLLSLFDFVSCLCRTGGYSLLYRSNTLVFFDCYFQISNHRPFSRVLSYKIYFTYYTGCMFTICFNPVFLCFYTQLFAGINRKLKKVFLSQGPSYFIFQKILRPLKCKTRSSIISRRCGTYTCTTHALRG